MRTPVRSRAPSRAANAKGSMSAESSAAKPKAKSRTLRANSPGVSNVKDSGTTPLVDQRPIVTFKPTLPVMQAGMRTEPAVSLPIGVGRRQIYRLMQAFRADGADGLISRKRGGPSNRALGSVFREIRPVRYQPTGQKPTAARSFTGRQRTAPWWQILGTTGRMVRLLPSGDDHPRRGQYWSEGCRKL
jgi:hypothetical protein